MSEETVGELVVERKVLNAHEAALIISLLIPAMEQHGREGATKLLSVISVGLAEVTKMSKDEFIAAAQGPGVDALFEAHQSLVEAK